MVALDYFELTNEQRRQIVNTQQAFMLWRPASAEIDAAGTYRVQTSNGRKYVYRVHGTVRKSLGPATESLFREKLKHDDRRRDLQNRIKTVQKRLDEMAPVNRAMNLGRLPLIAAKIIRALDRENLLGSHVIIAGTNALYAYEIASGVAIHQPHVATDDADLLWDTSQSLLLAATGIRREGLMGILRRVDRTFVADYGYNATNSEGYIVDLLCPEPADFTTMKAGADLEAVPMMGIQWLLDCPQFTQTVIAEDGWPIRMIVPEPRTYAIHKLWVSRRADRQPLKKPRDMAHSKIVSELCQTYLGLKFTAKDMPWLKAPLKGLLKETSAHVRKKKS